MERVRQSRTFDLNQSQEQSQQLNLEQQQSLCILQVVREELNTLLLDLAQANPLMIVEDTQDMLPIDKMMLEEALKVADNQYDASTMETNQYHNPDNHQAFINQLSTSNYQSFRSFLIDQILCYRQTRLRDLMLKLVDELDKNGFLSTAHEELRLSLECNQIELLDAITLIQQLEPVGIGASNLREYWMIQTEQDDFAPNIAYIILESYFEPLLKREFQFIADQLNVKVQAVIEAVDYYQKLGTTPITFFEQDEIHYIEPDVFLQQEDGHYKVSYNFTNLPKLEFNELYYQELKQIDDQELKQYIQGKKHEVHAIMNSLKRREITLIQVTQAIIEAQEVFFKSKGHQLAPLTLMDIADECGLSPSTISRTVQGKYFYTDFGSFQLKDLFDAKSVKSASGESVSQHEVLQLIRKLVDEEDKKKPLSDQKLADRLKDKGYPVARRTVTKYRQQLNIFSTRQRRMK